MKNIIKRLALGLAFVLGLMALPAMTAKAESYPPPADIKISAADKKIVAAWDAPNTTAKSFSYEVEVYEGTKELFKGKKTLLSKKKEDGSGNYVQFELKTKEFVIGKTYNIRARRTYNGGGEWSEKFTIKAELDKSSPVSKLTASMKSTKHPNIRLTYDWDYTRKPLCTDMIIYRSEDGGKKFKKIATTKAAVSYVDKTAKADKSYVYQIEVKGKADGKAFTFKKSAKSKAYLNIPAPGVTTQTIWKNKDKYGDPTKDSSSDYLEVKWSKVKGLDGFELQWKPTEKAKEYKTLKKASLAKAGSFKITPDKMKRSRYYDARIRGYKKINGKVKYSEWIPYSLYFGSVNDIG